MSAVRSTPAHAVSSAVQQRLPREPSEATVLLRTSGAIHVDAGGFVVAILDRRSPLAPNAIVVPVLLSGSDLPAPGDAAMVSASGVRAGAFQVSWDPGAVPLWEPRVASPAWLEPRDAAAWAAVVLRELSPARALTAEQTAERLFGAADLDARTGLVELLGSIRRRDPGAARSAARLLTGRGPGLTPAGDDLIAGAAVTLAALGGALGFGAGRRRAWQAAALLPDLADRTTAVSATLLRLAAAGLGLEPIHGVLHGAVEPERGLRSLRRLLGIGHTTGWATAAAAGLCMSELAGVAAPNPTGRSAHDA